MTYLVFEIWVALLVVFLLGLILGYCLGKCGRTTCPRKGDEKENYSHNHNQSLDNTDNNMQSSAQETAEDTAQLDGEGYEIETLEGIGKHTGQRFREAGIATIGDVLRQLRSSGQRLAFAETMGMKADPIHEWASMADLIRVEGMGNQFAELVQACGVRTVADLAAQNASRLTKSMTETNHSGRQLIAPTDPEEHVVQDWISAAKSMPTIVEM